MAASLGADVCVFREPTPSNFCFIDIFCTPWGCAYTLDLTHHRLYSVIESMLPSKLVLQMLSASQVAAGCGRCFYGEVSAKSGCVAPFCCTPYAGARRSALEVGHNNCLSSAARVCHSTQICLRARLCVLRHAAAKATRRCDSTCCGYGRLAPLLHSSRRVSSSLFLLMFARKETY